MTISDFFTKGEPFFKWGDKSRQPNDPEYQDYSVRLFVDPGGHLLYWERKNEEDTDAHYVFVDEIVDVRTGDRSNSLSSLPGDYRPPVMTIVTNVDFVHPRFFTFMHKRSERSLQRWASFLFTLAQQRRVARYPGQLFFMERLLAPLRFTSCAKFISIDSIVALLVPSSHNNTERQRMRWLILRSSLAHHEEVIPRKSIDSHFIFDMTMLLTGRNELRDIFHKITNGAAAMTSENLHTFLREKQHDGRLNEILHPPPTAAQVASIIRRFSAKPDSQTLNWREFAHFLLSDLSPDLDERRFKRNDDDLHEPLSHYYISTSHNTYCTGNQINTIKFFNTIHHDRSTVDIEVYRQILLGGCRCIELDLWDGCDDEPIITHGPMEVTKMNSVLVKDVCVAIADSAFRSSDLPVVLSLENHCSVPQQKKVAQYFTEIFGDLLLTEPLPEFPLEEGIPLPSPMALRNKIIVKAKGNRKHAIASAPSNGSMKSNDGEPSSSLGSDASVQTTITDASSQRALAAWFEKRKQLRRGSISVEDALRIDDEAPEEMRISKMLPAALPPQEANRLKKHPLFLALLQLEQQSSETASTSRANSTESEQCNATVSSAIGGIGSHNSALRHKILELKKERDANVKAERESNKIAPELAAQVNYLQAVSASHMNIDDPYRPRIYYQMHSLNEDAMAKTVKSEEKACIMARHTIKQIVRVYPSGIRIASSNYLPIFCWMVGCQMAALNFQTNGLPVLLNQALFADNGMCGYVLKPKCLRQASIDYNPYAKQIPEVVPESLHVTVISGQFLSMLTTSGSHLSTQVTVDLYDLPHDTIRNKYATRVVTRNGMNPVYYQNSDDQAFVFEKIIKPEGAFLILRVLDAESGVELAHRILPVHKMNRGYRHVELRSAANRPLGPASIFCYFKPEFYVLSTQKDLQLSLMDPVRGAQRRDRLAENFLDPVSYRLAANSSLADGQEPPGNSEVHLLRRSWAVPLPSQPNESLDLLTPRPDLLPQASITESASRSITAKPLGDRIKKFFGGK